MALGGIEGLARAEWIDSTQITRAEAQVLNRLMEKFWPGPLTLVLPRNPAVIPDLVTSGGPTVALRCPEHRVAQALLSLCELPLAAPSANRFGSVSPTTAEHVQKELGDRIPWIVDGGPCSVGVESTVVQLKEGALWVLRPGGVSIEALQAAIDIPVKLAQGTTIASPGTLASHYAPSRKLTLLPARLAELRQWPDAPEHVGVLAFSGPSARVEAALRERLKGAFTLRVLSERGDAREAAQNLFSHLRELDSSGAQALWAEPCPLQGLGAAIMDRLTRAAAPREQA